MLDATYRFEPKGDQKEGLKPSDGVPASAFATEDHTELRHVVYQNVDGSIVSGVWECAPMSLDIASYSTTELMTVLSGNVSVIDADGHRETFTAGDTFLIPKGAKVTLEITDKLLKYFLKVK